jgi:uncharacterized membrane protein
VLDRLDPFQFLLLIAFAAVLASIALIWIGKTFFGLKRDTDTNPDNFLNGLPTLKYFVNFGVPYALKKFWINIPFWILIIFFFIQRESQFTSPHAVDASITITALVAVAFAWNDIKKLMTNDISFIPTYFGLACFCLLAIAAIVKLVDNFIVPVGKHERIGIGWAFLLFYPTVWALIMCGLAFKFQRVFARLGKGDE